MHNKPDLPRAQKRSIDKRLPPQAALRHAIMVSGCTSASALSPSWYYGRLPSDESIRLNAI
jgi:hypothetical protein